MRNIRSFVISLFFLYTLEATFYVLYPASIYRVFTSDEYFVGLMTSASYVMTLLILAGFSFGLLKIDPFYALIFAGVLCTVAQVLYVVGVSFDTAALLTLVGVGSFSSLSYAFAKANVDAAIGIYYPGDLDRLTRLSLSVDYLGAIFGAVGASIILFEQYQKYSLVLPLFGVTLVFALWSSRPRQVPKVTFNHESEISPAFSGLGSFIRGDDRLIGILLIYFLIGLCSMAAFSTSVILKWGGGVTTSPWAIGSTQSAWTIGGLLETIFLDGIISRKVSLEPRIWIGWAIAGLGIAVTGMLDSIVSVFLAGLIWGAGTAIGIAATRIVTQSLLPPERKSAFFSIASLISLIGASIGAISAGYLSTWITANVALVAQGAVLALFVPILCLPFGKAVTKAGIDKPNFE